MSTAGDFSAYKNYKCATLTIGIAPNAKTVTPKKSGKLDHPPKCFNSDGISELRIKWTNMDMIENAMKSFAAMDTQANDESFLIMMKPSKKGHKIRTQNVTPRTLMSLWIRTLKVKILSEK